MKTEQLAPRVTALEISVQSISKDLHELARYVKEQQNIFLKEIKEEREISARANESLSVKLEKLGSDLSTTQKPDWHLYVAIIGLIFLLLGAVGYPMYLNDNFNTKLIDIHADEIKMLRLDIKELRDASYSTTTSK